MVGIPRSGGCHTCRRRRVKCDEQRPQCQRCRDDSKACEGYERWATYINRSSTGGLQKRGRLEEAIIPQIQGLNMGGESSRQVAGARQADVGIRADISPGVSSRSAVAPSADMIRSSCTPADPELASLDRDLLVRFLDLYVPASPVEGAGPPGGPLCWLPAACQLPHPIPVLRLALYALAASRVAFVDDDVLLGKESLRCYGETLKLLCRILGGSDPPEVKADNQVLMACQCLMIFELFGPAITSPRAVESHLKGMVRIAAMRAPQRFRSPVALALLGDIRALDVVASIQEGRASSLAAPEWRLTTEPKTLREAEQRLRDLSLDLGTLFAEEKAAKAIDTLSRRKTCDLLSRMSVLATEFTDACERFEQLSPKPLPGKRFADANSAAFVSWYLILLLQASLWAHGQLDGLATAGDAGAEAGNLEAGDLSEQIPPLAPFFEGQSPGWRESICRETLDALEYLTQKEMGLFGVQVSIYPILMLLWLLPSDHEAFARAADLYERLVARGVSPALDHPLAKVKKSDSEYWQRVGAV